MWAQPGTPTQAGYGNESKYATGVVFGVDIVDLAYDGDIGMTVI